MDQQQKRDAARNDIVSDATRAAVAYLVEHLGVLPADRTRIAALFSEVVHAAIEYAIVLDRRERVTPGNN
jgi:hypothetical protein